VTDQLEQLKEALAGQYAVERELGSGGMAVVYLAEDLKHRRKVAVKLLRPEIAKLIGSERFLREIEIAARLQHPHILPLYDSGAAGGFLYYVMPYVEGEALSERLDREGSLAPDEALRIAGEVASALDYAHRQGFVHRDIKPANIMISTTGGHAMVADFGIARAVSAAEAPGITRTGVVVGTPGYMPPEQLSGTEVSPATDVYAAAMVLYQSLTGRRWPVLQATHEADWSGVSRATRSALERALAWDPKDRWPDGAMFRRELLRAQGAPAPLGRGWAWVVGAAVAVVVGVAVVLGGVRLWPGGNAPVVATRIAVLPFSVRGSQTFEYLGEGVVDLLSVKLDGAGTLRSVDPRAVLGVVERRGGDAPDPADGLAIAESFSAGLYVLGNIVEVGGRLRFDASLYDRAQGLEPVAQASAEGQPIEVLDLLDEIAGELLAGHGALRGSRITQIALVTTDSLPALKSYLRGIREFRAARYPEAGMAFQEAVAADTSFALAWYQLSVTADWMLRAELARESAEQAVLFADRLAERDRRLLEALLAVREGDVAGAERLYREIVGMYPDDVEAWSQLSELLFHFKPRLGGRLEDSRDAWERLVALDPDQPPAFVHLARLAIELGDTSLMDSLASRAIALSPEGDRVVEMRMLQAFTRHDPDGRAQVLADLARVSNDELASISWSAGTFLGHPADGEAVTQVMTATSRSTETRAYGYMLLVFTDLAQGKWASAGGWLDELRAVDPTMALEFEARVAITPFRPAERPELDALVERLIGFDAAAVAPSAAQGVWFAVHNGLHPLLQTYLLGVLSARLGDGDAARRYAEQAQRIDVPPMDGSLQHDIVRRVQATDALVSGDTAAALALLEEVRLQVWHQLSIASPFISGSLERYLLARLLEEAGRHEEALRWYGSFEGVALHDRVYAAPAHWRRARIHEVLGDREQAVLHYQRFVELWRDADPELEAMVTEARSELERLGGGP
jgi:serine/threonine-protein kinase